MVFLNKTLVALVFVVLLFTIIMWQNNSITNVKRNNIECLNPSFASMDQDNKFDEFVRNQWTDQGKIQPAIDAVFGGSKNGIFVESGAFDGEIYSTTLHLVRDFKCIGLLVEPNPRNLDDILQKSRHCWKFKGCLSPVPFATHLPLPLTKIDFFSLDIESSELKVFRTIPFT